MRGVFPAASELGMRSCQWDGMGKMDSIRSVLWYENLLLNGNRIKQWRLEKIEGGPYRILRGVFSNIFIIFLL